jgi:hypothetical protein
MEREGEKRGRRAVSIVGPITAVHVNAPRVSHTNG